MRANLTESLSRNSYQLSEIVVSSTRHGMLLNRKDDVHEIIRSIGKQQGVNKIRIYNKSGEIVFSTDSLEIGKLADTRADACVVCHQKDGSLAANLPPDQMMRMFKNDKDEDVLGLIHPIKNEKDCYTSECHAHSGDRAILGVIDIIVPTESMNTTIAGLNKNIVISSIILTILLSGLSGMFIFKYVNKPVHKIVEGIKEVSRGNLSHKINFVSDDELGVVSEEFDSMTDKLKTAYDQLQEWSLTLNQRVEEKNLELKKIYEQINQIEKLASLGKLSATVAHELNNPLEGILTFSKLIIKKLQKYKSSEHDEIISFLEVIAEESSRCGRIVKDLLLFSRQQDEVRVLSNAGDLIDKSLLLIRHHFEINKITVTKDYESSDLSLVCDPQRIEQAIVALLMNAVEAMPQGGQLLIRAGKSEDNCFIQIIDSGKGISEKDLPYIFEPFYSTKSEQKGTGLGLAVVYGIVTGHKGNIYVKDTSANGTTIEITLPV